MDGDLFSLAPTVTLASSPVLDDGPWSPERTFCVDLADSSLQTTPDKPVWKWAEETVWLDEKMAATPGFFDSSRTPWTREWQQLPMQHDVREAIAMKSSQSGFTEGSLNILRWMPNHWPGNALYAINSKEKGAEVSDKRIHPTLQKTAGAKISDDPNDLATRKISLTNMEIIISGSGSSGPFMEAWYRAIFLDELENHEQNQETTTYDRAKSRQATVPDGKLFAMSKPELAGGIIDLNYIRGTQEKWLVPCPCCGQRIELLWEFVRFGHCKALFGWDLERVLKETYYQCQKCGGKIEEHQKAEMVNAGIWVPTPAAQRRRPPSGNVVPAEPGVRSFQISDLYSLWQNMTWGFLASVYLNAFVIEPNESRQKYFRTNHLGLPWDPKEFQVNEDALLLLVAGITEKRGESTVQLGIPYELSYIGKEWSAYLPPIAEGFDYHLTISGDRQQNCYKFWVQAWTWDGQGHLVDIGEVPDEDAFLDLRLRPYYVEGREEPYYIKAGVVDCGDEKMKVLRMCIAAWQHGWELHPSRGSGFHSEFKGKNLRYYADTCDGVEIWIREFYDHAVKNDFYMGKIGKRSEPRLWFPRNVPPAAYAELRAERFTAVNINGRPVQKWTHDKQKHGPNDFGDCGKVQYGVILPEIKEDLKKLNPAFRPTQTTPK